MKQTPLHAVHLALKAKMAEFAGYDMPIQYADGVMAEHNWTRSNATIFDVSHMGQIWIDGDEAAAFLEHLTPSAIAPLKEGAAKYTVLMNDAGGMIDDLIITRVSPTRFFLVVNGACKEKDIAWMNSHLSGGVTLTHLQDRGLIALQGPTSVQVLRDTLGIDVSELGYMKFREVGDYFIFRLGYTGEDGFEISMPADQTVDVWNKLLGHEEVKPAGLASRDSLRLDMGYPLYGHDIDATTTPLEADIGWVMRKEAHDFIGANKVTNPPRRKRVGIKLIDKGIAREGCEIFAEDGKQIGTLTSGGFSPTLNAAIAMGYVETPYAIDGAKVSVIVRGRDIAAEIAPFPFVQPQTHRIKK